MATHSSVLAWRISGMGEPGGLLSMGLHRVGHDWSDLAAAAAARSWIQIQLTALLLCILLSFFLKIIFKIVYYIHLYTYMFVVQSPSHVQLLPIPWTAASYQAYLSLTISRNLPKCMTIESVMPFNHLILCCPLLLLPSIFPSIRVFPMSHTYIHSF